MSDHDVLHEAELELLAGGPAEPRAAFARSRLANCATCRQQIDALLAARERLRTESQFLRDALRAATATVGGIEARAEERIASPFGKPPGAPPVASRHESRARQLWSVFFLLLALAALFAASTRVPGAGPVP